jgi:hypothetical protein
VREGFTIHGLLLLVLLLLLLLLLLRDFIFLALWC